MTTPQSEHGSPVPSSEIRVLIVTEHIQHTEQVRHAIGSFLPKSAVVSVASTHQAREVLGRQHRSGPEQWFVICGLEEGCWATLVLLEWIRSCSPISEVRAGLLTDRAAELLPVSLTDQPGVRLLPASPSAARLRSWIEAALPGRRVADDQADLGQEAAFECSTFSAGPVAASTVSRSFGSCGSTIT
jgi:hypothetical protein